MPKIMNIRIGAKVSITHNLDQEAGIVNGTKGYVKVVHNNVVIIEEEHTKTLIPVTKVKQKIHVSKTNKTYYRVMFPLMLSWVSTIHRGQGFTVDVLHTYLDNSVFADGQAYTALSHVQKLENLHLKELNVSAFKTSSVVREIMTTAKEENLLKTVGIEIKQKRCKKDSLTPQVIKTSGCSIPIICDTSKKQSNPQSDPQQNDNTDNTDSDELVSVTEKIDAKMKSLGKEIFCLHLFMKPINTKKLADLCSVHKPTFNMMMYYQQSSPSYFTESSDIVETRYVFPNSFLKEYVPVKTPGDGNCLFHAISISLNGTLNLTRHLRLLAAFVMIQNKTKFLEIIQAD